MTAHRLSRERLDSPPHKAAALLLAAARTDPALRRAAEQVQDALIALDDEAQTLRTELEAGEVRAEWGARYPDGQECGYGAGPEARARAEHLLKIHGGQLVQREVRIGPWSEVAS